MGLALAVDDHRGTRGVGSQRCVGTTLVPRYRIAPSRWCGGFVDCAAVVALPEATLGIWPKLGCYAPVFRCLAAWWWLMLLLFVQN